jgi:hypothetical protein
MIDIHASSNDHELHVHDDDSKKPSFELMMETLSEIVEEHLKKKSQFHDDGLPKEAVQKLLKNTLSQPGTIDLRSQENFENSLESQHH